MKANTNPLRPGTFYHVYNRGINGEDLFKEEKNYSVFLQKYISHVDPVVNTYAYCLLKNHFHFLIETKSEEEIKAYALIKHPTKGLESLERFISNQFAHLFNGYSQVINLSYNRTGGLFEKPFRRIEISNNAYLSQMIWYIHFNPQKHGFVDDFKDYVHSSYHSHLASNATRLKREAVLGWFGNKNDYTDFHRQQNNEKGIRDLVIEFD